MKQSNRKLFLRILTVLGIALAVVWSLQSFPQAQGNFAGNDTCKTCHKKRFESFAKTSHVKCEDCHGAGKAHADAGGDTAKITSFSDLTEKEANETCMECHSRQETHFTFNKSMHSMSDVACVDCHTGHPAKDNRTDANLKAQGAKLCYDCHPEKEAEFDMPRHHPLPEDDKGCVNCHDPHGGPRKQLKASGNQACFDCHTEKEGPFVYEHDIATVETCNVCHSIHGTRNRHLLKHEDERGLCLSCHDTVPGWHGTAHIEGNTYGCTACHQAIHGSNISPYFLEE